MSFHNKPNYQIPELIEALKAHRLPHDTPSQLADSFRIGWMACRELAQADSVPAIQGEMNVQLDTDSNPTAPGQQRDVARSVALGQPMGNGQDQAAGRPSAQGDKLLTVAERNIRSFLRSAQFKCESDREAALNCVDVLWAAARDPADSVPAVERKQERIAFKDAHRHLDLDEVPDAWGRPMFKHSHVEASWLGWIARAVLAKWGQPAHSGEPVAWLNPWRADQVTTDYDAYGEHGIALYTAPQPAPAPLIARSLAEWHEEDGYVAWWAWNGREWAGEPAWIGTPNCEDWPGYHTHWTPHTEQPVCAALAAQGGK